MELMSNVLSYTLRDYNGKLMLLNISEGDPMDVGNYFFPIMDLDKVLKQLEKPYEFLICLESSVFGQQFEIILCETPEEMPESIVTETKRKLRFIEEKGLKLGVEWIDPLWRA